MGIHGRDYMRDRSVLDGSTFGVEARPRLTWALLGIFLAAWMLFAASWGPGVHPKGSAGRDIWQSLLLHPGAVIDTGAWWQPFTSIWFHDPIGVWHLAVSVVLLLLFGLRSERRWGPGRVGLLVIAGALLTQLVAWASAPLVARPGWVALGPTGGLFALAGAAAWRGRGEVVSYFGRGPWPLTRVAAVALVVAFVVLASRFEGRAMWPLLPFVLGHGAAIGLGLLLAPRDAPAGEPPPRRERREPAPAANVGATDDAGGTRARVDRLLEKIAAEGMDALTEEERAFLDDASKGYR